MNYIYNQKRYDLYRTVLSAVLIPSVRSMNYINEWEMDSEQALLSRFNPFSQVNELHSGTPAQSQPDLFRRFNPFSQVNELHKT